MRSGLLRPERLPARPLLGETPSPALGVAAGAGGAVAEPLARLRSPGRPCSRVAG